MNIVNLTPHDIVIIPQPGDTPIVIPPSGTVARLTEHTKSAGTLNGVIPVTVRNFEDKIEGLPERERNTVYITSMLVADAAWAAGRSDVYCPGEAVRDSTGRIIGAKSLCAISGRWH